MTYLPLVISAPAPSNSTPPGIGTTGDAGTSASYSRSDHTHASSVQRQRVSIPLTSGKGTWVFPVAYANGIVPVIETTAETPDGAAYTYDAKIIAGSVSNTQCTVIVSKIANSITLPSLATSLLGLVLNIVAPATGTVIVHCWAAVPTS